jgi:hypothetical protein
VGGPGLITPGPFCWSMFGLVTVLLTSKDHSSLNSELLLCQLAAIVLND